jgi:glycosyltransferase involved in cell wall biosynthesis
VQALNEMGVNAWVLHPKSNFKCTWFEHNTPTWNSPTISTDDHLIIPEVDVLALSGLLIKNQIKFSIFVQGGGIHRGNTAHAIKMVNMVYQKSQCVLAISDEIKELIATYFPNTANKIIRVLPTVPRKLFALESWQNKENLITYMPRKNAAHAESVIVALASRLPSNWRIQAIENASESEVAAWFNKSRIFLTFSTPEGFGLPPLEAALSGNFVIGYHGNGGKEYWQPPVFHEIYPYDIKSFVAGIISRINALEKTNGEDFCESADFHSVIQRLSDKYSTGELKISLRNFVELANPPSFIPDAAPKQVTIQHSPLTAWLIKKYKKNILKY